MNEPRANGYARNETVAFERSDVDTRVLLYFVAGLGVSLAAVMAVIWFFFAFLVRTDLDRKRSTYDLAEQFRTSRPKVEDRLPAGPRLEGMGVNTPGGHTIGRMWPSTVAIQAVNDVAALDGGGWIEPGRLARIPIRDAIARLAKDGPAPKSAYEQLPSGSSSGRATNGGAAP